MKKNKLEKEKGNVKMKFLFLQLKKTQFDL